MMTLPAQLSEFMKGPDLNGLKPFALLYRNKWNSSANKYELESTPIDISDLIVKPNTLSMSLDVNEVAQYNVNNVTLTLSDTKNYFVEGTPNSYFPDGYQLYGSRVVLYYGLDSANRTPLFTGVIKDLPTHKPEQYQVELKLVSPLEMLKDIEAKDFSNKVTGETLTYKSTDSDGHRVYWTSGTGVGGFDAVYANGTKLFEGIDFKIDRLNSLIYPAIVTIIDSTYYEQTITADYYTWKRDLTVEQIVTGLAELGGYDSDNEDIRAVEWTTAIRNPPVESGFFAGIGYYQSGDHEYTANWRPTRNNTWTSTTAGSCRNTLPQNFDYYFQIQVKNENDPNPFGGSSGTGCTIISLGDSSNSSSISDGSSSLGVSGVTNGISVRLYFEITSSPLRIIRRLYVHRISGGTASLLYSEGFSGTVDNVLQSGLLSIRRRGNSVTVYKGETQIAATSINTSLNFHFQGQYTSGSRVKDLYAYNQSWNLYSDDLNLTIQNITKPSWISSVCDKTTIGQSWGAISAILDGAASYFLQAYFSNDLAAWSNPTSFDLNTPLARTERYLTYVLGVASAPSNVFKIELPSTYYISSILLLNLVNLSNRTVLEALQDFALISGYEFGVNREGTFFFRSRRQSTAPQYVLGHEELVKVDTVKKNLNEFFTKLTLTFAARPIEFYADEGERPTLTDKYGVINKEIDKPDIVNYDNPELAQAIGPQLLATYAELANTIQATCKINLALELGDIVSLRRNMNLITPDNFSDYTKYAASNIYYRACKITGMNYNFAKRQITYTLRDVSNPNTEPGYEFEHYIYDLAVPFGVKE